MGDTRQEKEREGLASDVVGQPPLPSLAPAWAYGSGGNGTRSVSRFAAFSFDCPRPGAGNRTMNGPTEYPQSYAVGSARCPTALTHWSGPSWIGRAMTDPRGEGRQACSENSRNDKVFFGQTGRSVSRRPRRYVRLPLLTQTGKAFCGLKLRCKLNVHARKGKMGEHRFAHSFRNPLPVKMWMKLVWPGSYITSPCVRLWHFFG